VKGPLVHLSHCAFDHRELASFAIVGDVHATMKSYASLSPDNGGLTLDRPRQTAQAQEGQHEAELLVVFRKQKARSRTTQCPLHIAQKLLALANDMKRIQCAQLTYHCGASTICAY
jgi:hypothetical protein